MGREEQARLEVGRTDVSPVVARAVVLVFLATIVAVPLVQTVAEARRCGGGPAGWWDRLGPRRIATAALRAGGEEAGGPVERVFAANRGMLSAIADVDAEVDERSVLGEALRPAVQGLLSGWLGAGNEKVYCGRDGWLFYRPSVDHVTGPGFLSPERLSSRASAGSEWEEPPQPDPRVAILEFRDQLASRGIELVVVPVPVKAAIHPEKLGADGGRPVENGSFSGWKSDLAEAGVHVFDPGPLLRRRRAAGEGPLYLATDTHWRPETAMLVADSLAAYVAGMDAGLRPGTSRMRVEESTMVGTGDLGVMLQLPEDQDLYPGEEVILQGVITESETLWRPDRTAEILLLGDSYTNIFSLPGMRWGEASGFAEHLSRALERPLDTIVRNDAGAHATRMMLSRELARGRDRLAGKKVVIWEFTSRELSAGDWRRLPMALGDAASGGFIVPEAGDSLRVRGTIAAVAPTPLPRSAPYADYIVALHLVDVEGAGDAGVDRQALVFTWAMRDYEWLAGARYRVGQELELVLRPWSDVTDEYETVSRGELFAADLLAQPPCWGVEPGAASTRRPDPGLQTPVAVSEPVIASAPSPLAGGDLRARYIAACDQLSRQLVRGGKGMVLGHEGWVLIRSELQMGATGTFWGDRAAQVNPRCAPEVADPLVGILDLKGQLDSLGVDLVVVTVPTRCAIYPESVLGAEAFPAGSVLPRLQPQEQEFYELLASRGVEVVDMTDAYLAARGDGGPPLYQLSDAHWSPRGAQMAAHEIARRIARRPWYRRLPKQTFRAEWGEGEHRGLPYRRLKNLTGEDRPAEMVRYRAIRLPGPDGGKKMERRNPEGSVILIGDSNCIHWSDFDASFQHQLAYELGLLVDSMHSRGGASYSARVNLARAIREIPGYLDGKKLLVWCMTSRELATAKDGWPQVDILP